MEDRNCLLCYSTHELCMIEPQLITSIISLLLKFDTETSRKIREIFKNSKFCGICVKKLKNISNMLKDFENLRKKLDECRIEIENQILKSSTYDLNILSGNFNNRKIIVENLTCQKQNKELINTKIDAGYDPRPGLSEDFDDISGENDGVQCEPGAVWLPEDNDDIGLEIPEANVPKNLQLQVIKLPDEILKKSPITVYDALIKSFIRIEKMSRAKLSQSQKFKIGTTSTYTTTKRFRGPGKKGRKPRNIYSCDIEDCSFIGRDKLRLQTHKLQEHGIEIQEDCICCHICNKPVSSKQYLDLHMKSHKNKNSPIDKKLKKSSKSEYFECQQSGCSFKSCHSSNFKIHALKHSGHRFYCETCGRGFSRQTTLDNHIKVKHLKTIQFQCEICSKMYLSNNALQNHIRNHSSARSYCSQCPMSFSQYSGLKYHEKSTHKKGLRIQCDKCELQFVAKFLLVRHQQNKHGLEKPSDCHCKYCSKSFITISRLKRHVLQAHSTDNEKPYQCVPCKKRFSVKEALFFHNKFHHPELAHISLTDTH